MERPISGDERSQRLQSVDLDRNIPSRESERIFRRRLHSASDRVEVNSVVSDAITDERVPLNPEINRKLKIRSKTVTLKDKGGRFLKENKSYKLSYDPDRSGGSEYEIEKASIDDSKDTRSDGATVVSFDVLGERQSTEDRISFNHNGSIDSELRRGSLNSTISSIIFTPKGTLKKPVLSNSLQQTAQRRLNERKLSINSDSNTNRKAVTPSVKSNDDDHQLGDTYPVEKPKIDKTLLPTPRDSTRASVTRVQSLRLEPPASPSVTRTQSLRTDSSARPSVARLSRAESTRASSSTLKLPPSVHVPKPSNAPIRHSSAKGAGPSHEVVKENSSTSLPPPNFKANLFTRVRKLSTPRKSPKFSPQPTTKTSLPVSNGHTKTEDKVVQRPNSNKSSSVKNESTFIKETPFSRFERLKSTESVRSHYDKTARVNVEDISDSEMPKIGVSRYEEVEEVQPAIALKPKRHTRIIPKLANNTKTAGSVQSITAGTSSTKLAVQNNPKSKLTVPQVMTRLTELPKLGSIDDSNNIFTEKDKLARLRQPQYISDDLKIMKTKLKDNDFVVQHLDSETLKQLQKKAALSELKKSKKNQNGATLAKSQTKVLLNSNFNNTNKTNTQNNSNSGVTKNKNVPLKTKNNAWSVQPKIHHIVPKKTQGNRTSPVRNTPVNSSETTMPNKPNKLLRNNTVKMENTPKRILPNKINNNTASNVASWVLEAVHETKMSNFSEPKHKQDAKRPPAGISRRKQIELEREQAFDTESKSSSSTANLINTGLYMPLRKRKLKRKPMRLKKRKLFTQVGKVKGYEVRNVYLKLELKRLNHGIFFVFPVFILFIFLNIKKNQNTARRRLSRSQLSRKSANPDEISRERNNST